MILYGPRYVWELGFLLSEIPEINQLNKTGSYSRRGALFTWCKRKVRLKRVKRRQTWCISHETLTQSPSRMTPHLPKLTFTQLTAVICYIISSVTITPPLTIKGFIMVITVRSHETPAYNWKLISRTNNYTMFKKRWFLVHHNILPFA